MADATISCPNCGLEAEAEVFPHHSGAGALDFTCTHCGAIGWTPVTAAEMAGLQAVGIDVEIPEPPITDAEATAARGLLGDTDAAWYDFWKAELGQH